jgi:hypothetical protein
MVTDATTDTSELDRAFAAIMARVVASGEAPHYTELASDLGVSMDRGKQLVVEIMAAGVPGWVHPGTDYIASFPPFNNQPTQYRITVDGTGRWYAQ